MIPSQASPQAPSGSRRRHYLLIALILALAAIPRFVALPYISADMRQYLMPWYQYIVAHGGWPASGTDFSDYTPAYLYLLTAVTFWRSLAPIAGIKLIPIVFDYVLAGSMYLLIRRYYGPGARALLALALVLFAPTVIINSALWGQEDSIYTAGLLLCVYCVLQKRPFWAALAFALSFAVKLQAVFLAPFLLVLCLRRNLSWVQVAILPLLVYMLFVLPSALLGQSLIRLLSVYFSQAGQSASISSSAPNLYLLCLLKNNLCDQPGLTVAAMVATGLGVIGLVWIFARRRDPLQPADFLLLALLSLALVPFLLPRMHERYFYPADILSLALALHRPRLWWVPLAFQVSSLLAYSGPLLQTSQLFALGGGVVNLVSIAFLALVALRYTVRDPLSALEPVSGD